MKNNISSMTSFTFYKLQWLKICFLDFFMIKKCCGNDVAAFAKLSRTTYVRIQRPIEICQW